MVDELSRRIAKRTVAAWDVARRKAHMASVDISSDNDEVDNHINHFNANRFALSDSSFSDDDITSFVNMITQDWKVGYKLWQQLTDALKDQITETRKKAMPKIDNGDRKPPSSGFRQPSPQGPARGNSDVIKALAKL